MLIKYWRYIVVHFVCMCCCCTNVFSNETDSLKRILATNIPDTARVDVLIALCRTVSHTSPDSSITIAASAKELAEKIGYKPGLALAIKNMGIGYYLQGKYKEAVLTWEQAIGIYTQVGDKKGVANMLSNQGSVYFNQGDDAKALELYLQSLKMSEET
ncbi:MAG: tetratricopeptide repeat protein, partial [Bacteroidota bacterium]